MSDRRAKPIGQGLFKGTDGIWKLPGTFAATDVAPVVDLGAAGPRWSRGFLVVSAANTSWWRIAEGLGSNGRGSFMLTITGGGGGFTPSVATYMICKSWQAHSRDVTITLLNSSSQGGCHTALRIDRDADGAYLDVKINASSSGGSLSYTITDSNPGPAAVRRWLVLDVPVESPATTDVTTFDLTNFSRSFNDVAFGVHTAGMDSADAGGFFVGGDSAGDGLVELAGNQMKMRFNPAGADYVDLYHDGSSLLWKPSATSEAFRWLDNTGASRFLVQVSTTTASNLFDLKLGGTQRFFNSTNADWVTMSHDGVDFRLQDGSGTTDFRITGMNLSMEQDSLKTYWGGGKDVACWYGGSNFNFQQLTNTNGDFQFLNLAGVNHFAFAMHATDANNIFHVFDGAQIKVWSSSNLDTVALSHDGTDANFVSTGTTQYTFDKGIRCAQYVIVDTLLRFVDSEVTLNSSGAIAVTRTRHKVDTYLDAATDNLDSITGGNDNQLLVLSSASNSRDTTIRDNVVTGENIHLDGQVAFTFTNSRDLMMLMYDSAAGQWMEISRSNNQ